MVTLLPRFSDAVDSGCILWMSGRRLGGGGCRPTAGGRIHGLVGGSYREGINTPQTNLGQGVWHRGGGASGGGSGRGRHSRARGRARALFIEFPIGVALPDPPQSIMKKNVK